MDKKSTVEPASGEYPVANRPAQKQIIPPKGEEYLREGGNIEDLPNPSEEKDAGQEKE